LNDASIKAVGSSEGVVRESSSGAIFAVVTRKLLAPSFAATEMRPGMR
jgi:hypothetical protein